MKETPEPSDRTHPGEAGVNPACAGDDPHMIEDIQVAQPEPIGEWAGAPYLTTWSGFRVLLESYNNDHATTGLTPTLTGIDILQRSRKYSMRSSWRS